jgi:hypothetical protein
MYIICIMYYIDRYVGKARKAYSQITSLVQSPIQILTGKNPLTLTKGKVMGMGMG